MLTTESLTTPVAELAITPASAADDSAWNAFVARHPQGSIFHRPEWDQVFRVYGLRSRRLVARRGEKLVGVVALVHQRLLGWDNRMVSLPWFDAAGVLAEDDPARSALIEGALAWAAQQGTAKLHLRQMEPLPTGPPPRLEKALLRLKLEPSAEALWKRVSAKVRNQVRKAQKSGLTATSGGAELLPAFHEVYATNMRDLGSPPHSPAYFQAVLAAFPAEARLHVVRLGEQVIGGGLTLASGSKCEIPWASSLRAYNSYCVNHLLYWHILEQACQAGYAWFHFGRSTKGSGTYHFKEQWGAEPWQLYWYDWGRAEPVTQRQADNERLALASRLWRRLPLGISRRLGPWLIARLS